MTLQEQLADLQKRTEAAITKAQTKVESGGNPNAVSPKGASGLMQIMPDTAKDPGFGLPSLDSSKMFDPEANVEFGQAYRQAMMKRYGNLDHSLAAYNWGPGNVDKWLKAGGDFSKLPTETQNYIASVKAQMGTQGAPMKMQGPDGADGPVGQSPQPGGEWANVQDPALKQQLQELEAKLTRQSSQPTDEPPELTSSIPQLENYLRGFWDRAAEVIAAPSEVGQELFNLIGLGVVKPGQYTESTKRALGSLGIETDAVDNLYGRLGKDTVDSLAILSTLYAAAPAMAARTGMTRGAAFVRELGKAIQKHPYLTGLQEAGAIVGVRGTEELVGKPKEGDPMAVSAAKTIAPFAGGLAGAGAVTAGAGIVKRGAGVVKRGASAIKEAFSPSQPTAQQDPLSSRTFDLDRTNLGQFAEEQLDNARAKLGQAVQEAVEAVPTTGTSAQVQSRMRSALERAERIGNRIVSEYWQSTPLNNRVPMTGIRRDVAAMRKELADTPSQMPEEFMDRLTQLSMPIRGADGRMIKSLPTIKRLRDFRGEIRRARIEEEAKVNTNAGLVRNYNRLEGVIDNAIQREYPNDVSIQQARNVSIMYHDMFSRSGLARILASKRSGAPLTPEDLSMEALLGKHKGLEDLQNVQKLGSLRKPDSPFPAATPAEQAQLKELENEAENSIRAMFREIAADKGPEAAAKWAVKNEKVIRTSAKASAELSMAHKKVFEALEQKKALERSALARFAKKDPEVAIRDVWSDTRDPVKANREIMQTISKDPEAMSAYQRGMIQELFKRGKNDIVAVRNLLYTSRYNKMLQEALDPTTFRRLQKVVEGSYQISQGEAKNVAQRMAPIFKLSARIFGATVGRLLGRVTGQSTIQTPGLIAGAAGQQAEKLLKWTNPSELLANAIVDPAWERILLERWTGNKFNYKQEMKVLRRTLAGIEGTRRNVLNQLDKETEQ